MKWLVCRKEAIRSPYREHQINSSCFPIIVETLDSEYENDHYKFFENIVMRAFDQIKEGYTGKHEYVVIPMNHAHTVSFKPRATYDVTVERYV